MTPTMILRNKQGRKEPTYRAFNYTNNKTKKKTSQNKKKTSAATRVKSKRKTASAAQVQTFPNESVNRKEVKSKPKKKTSQNKYKSSAATTVKSNRKTATAAQVQTFLNPSPQPSDQFNELDNLLTEPIIEQSFDNATKNVVKNEKLSLPFLFKIVDKADQLKVGHDLRNGRSIPETLEDGRLFFMKNTIIRTSGNITINRCCKPNTIRRHYNDGYIILDIGNDLGDEIFTVIENIVKCNEFSIQDMHPNGIKLKCDILRDYNESDADSNFLSYPDLRLLDGFLKHGDSYFEIDKLSDAVFEKRLVWTLNDHQRQLYSIDPVFMASTSKKQCCLGYQCPYCTTCCHGLIQIRDHLRKHHAFEDQKTEIYGTVFNVHKAPKPTMDTKDDHVRTTVYAACYSAVISIPMPPETVNYEVLGTRTCKQLISEYFAILEGFAIKNYIVNRCHLCSCDWGTPTLDDKITFQNQVIHYMRRLFKRLRSFNWHSLYYNELKNVNIKVRGTAIFSMIHAILDGSINAEDFPCLEHIWFKFEETCVDNDFYVRILKSIDPIPMNPNTFICSETEDC